MSQENLQQAVEYLRGNKERYSQEVLGEQLQKAGYSVDVVNKAFKQVFPDQQQKSKTGFFNFTHRKTYSSAGEKILDFIVGFLGTFVLGFLINMVVGLFFAVALVQWILVVALYIGVVVYLWRRRRYIAIGVLSSVLASVLLVGILFAFLFVGLRSSL